MKFGWGHAAAAAAGRLPSFMIVGIHRSRARPQIAAAPVGRSARIRSSAGWTSRCTGPSPRRVACSPRAQALEHCSDAEIRRLVARGRWRRTPWRGVLIDGELPDSSRRRSALPRWRSGRIWSPATRRQRCCGASTSDRGGRVCTSSVRRSWSTAAPGIQVHPSSLGCDDAVWIEGVWCTPAGAYRVRCRPSRRPPIDGLATLDAALRSAPCTRDELEAAAAAAGRLAGGDPAAST